MQEDDVTSRNLIQSANIWSIASKFFRVKIRVLPNVESRRAGRCWDGLPRWVCCTKSLARKHLLHKVRCHTQVAGSAGRLNGDDPPLLECCVVLVQQQRGHVPVVVGVSINRQVGLGRFGVEQPPFGLFDAIRIGVTPEASL